MLTSCTTQHDTEGHMYSKWQVNVSLSYLIFDSHCVTFIIIIIILHVSNVAQHYKEKAPKHDMFVDIVIQT